MGQNGRGWRRFLVFAELTKSKKGAEYVALFTFFSFQAWIRIIFCQGPRQVVNALTLYSVFQANLEPTAAKNVGSALSQFFKNIGILASQQHQQAVILSGMLFTLVIWLFAALSLILAILFYLLFLWHYIPNRDGGLSGYCERKINDRLSKIVSAKVNKALEEEERKRIKADAKAAKKGEKPQFGRQATLPTLFDAKDDKLPNMPMLNRNDTMTTLPLYTSRPGTPSSQQPSVPSFELDQLDKRPGTSRTVTGSSAMSNVSYASNAPLMGNASDMAYGRSGSPAPSLPSLDTSNFPAQPQRTMTGSTNATNFSRGPPRMPSAMGDRGYTQSPVSYTDRSPSAMRNDSIDSYGRPMPRQDFGGRNTPTGPPGPPRRFDQYSQGRSSPAPGSEFGRNSPAPMTPTNGGGYQPYNTNQRSASTAPYPNNSQPMPQQQRNMTDPGFAPPSSDYFSNQPLPSPQRSATGMTGRYTPNGRNGSGGSGFSEGPARLASPAPYVNNANGRGSPAFGPGPPQGGYRR